MRARATLLFLLLCTGAFARPGATWEFALSLGGTSNGQLFSLFLVKVFEGQVVESRPLSRENFIRQAQGRAFSEANPDADDLFRKYGVDACTLPPDSAAMGFLTDCTTLDDLWKLKFWEYPLQARDGQRTGKGWSEAPLRPSDRQLGILAAYGMEHTSDLVIGEHLFHLLRDMGNKAWVNRYRQG